MLPKDISSAGPMSSPKKTGVRKETHREMRVRPLGRAVVAEVSIRCAPVATISLV